MSEAKAYKMLYDNQVKSNDAILKTIFYALGGLGTAVLLVFGSNWWFNDKKVKDIINEIDSKIKAVNNVASADLIEKFNKFSNEKSSGIAQAQTKLLEEVTNAIADLTLKFAEFAEKIRKEVKDDSKEYLNNYQKQLESFNENYRQQISSMNENFTAQYSNLKELINGKDGAIRELISSEQDKRVDDLNGIYQTISRVEFYMWKDIGVFRNAFASLLSELDYRLKKKTTTAAGIKLTLDQMSETLDKCQYILASDKKMTIGLIQSLPENAETIKKKAEILAKLEKIRIEPA